MLLFARPCRWRLSAAEGDPVRGKSTVEEIAVLKEDVPNFFIEGVMIADGAGLYGDSRDYRPAGETRAQRRDPAHEERL